MFLFGIVQFKFFSPLVLDAILCAANSWFHLLLPFCLIVHCFCVLFLFSVITTLIPVEDNVFKIVQTGKFSFVSESAS